MFGCDKRHAVFLCPGDAALERGRQKDARHLEKLHAGLVREFDGVVGPVGRVAHGFERRLANRQQLRARAAERRVPEVFAVTVAVVHGHAREVARLDAVQDRVVLALFHEDLVHAQDEMRAEGRGDAVEVVEGTGIAVQLARFVVLRAVELAHPGAFHDLKCLGDDLRENLAGVLGGHLAVLERVEAVLHLLRRLVAGKAQAHGLPEELLVVRQEIERTFAVAQQVLRGVRRIARAEEHGIVFPARDVVGRDERIRPDRGAFVLGHRADEHGRHREKGRGLIEVVNDPQVFKTGHSDSSHNQDQIFPRNLAARAAKVENGTSELPAQIRMFSARNRSAAGGRSGTAESFGDKIAAS